MDSARSVNGGYGGRPIFRLGEVYTKDDFIGMLGCSERTWKEYRRAGLRPLYRCKTHYFLSDHVVSVATAISAEDDQE